MASQSPARQPVPRGVKILRWAARLWSLVLFFMVVIIAVAPDTETAGEGDAGGLQVAQLILVALFLVAVLALLAAWKWEGPGGAVAVIAGLVHLAGFFAVEGFFPGQLIVVSLVVVPGTVFLACSRMSARE